MDGMREPEYAPKDRGTAADQSVPRLWLGTLSTAGLVLSAKNVQKLLTRTEPNPRNALFILLFGTLLGSISAGYFAVRP